MVTEENNEIDEINLCDSDNLKKFSEKHGKCLVISGNDNESAAKITRQYATEDLKVLNVKNLGPCEINNNPGNEKSSTAFLIEDGEVKKRITVQNDMQEDFQTQNNVFTDRQAQDQDCRVKFKVDTNTWSVEAEEGSACKREVSNLTNLPTASQKYLKNHIRFGKKD